MNDVEACLVAASLLPPESHWARYLNQNAAMDPHPYAVWKARRILKGERL